MLCACSNNDATRPAACCVQCTFLCASDMLTSSEPLLTLKTQHNTKVNSLAQGQEPSLQPRALEPKGLQPR